MPGLLGLIVLVLDIIAILDVLKRPITNERKAIWIVLILILPFLGMVLYFLLEKNK